MPDPDIIETPKNAVDNNTVALRENTLELKMMRNEIMRFNLFIASISQKAGIAGTVQSLLETFMKITGSGGKKK